MLSILIVNSDGLEDTLNCLQSVYQNPPCCTFEVILLDNNSSINPTNAVTERFPKVKIIISPYRSGFSFNYNKALSFSSGEYIAFLNNDIEVSDGAFDRLLSVIQSDQSIGLLGPKLLTETGKPQINCAGVSITPVSYFFREFFGDNDTPFGKIISKIQERAFNRLNSGPVEFVCGAFMLVTRSALLNVGVLDERYVVYFEDVEWCRRFRHRGYQVYYETSAVAIHHGDRSLKRVRSWAKKGEYLGALLFFREYHQIGILGCWLLWCLYVLNCSCRWFAYFLLIPFRGPDVCKAYWSVLCWLILDGFRATTSLNGWNVARERLVAPVVVR